VTREGVSIQESNPEQEFHACTLRSRFIEVLKRWTNIAPTSAIGIVIFGVVLGKDGDALLGIIMAGLILSLGASVLWAGGTYLLVSNYKWVQHLPRLKTILSYNQIRQLEKVREEFALDPDIFFGFVTASTELGRKIIERDYRQLKMFYPDKAEQAILKELLVKDLKIDYGMTDNSEDTELTVRVADQLIRNISTLEQLCGCVASLERSANPDFHSSAPMKRIDEIMSRSSTLTKGVGQ